MAEPTDNSDTNGAPDPAEKIAGNPDAGARTPAAPGGVVAKNAAATDESQGGKPVTTPTDPQAGAAPGQGASAPPPPSAASSGNTPEQEARIAAMKAKIEALKAEKAAGGGATPAPAAASAPSAGASAAAVAEPAVAAARPAAAAKPAPPKKTGPPKPKIGSTTAPKGKEPEVGVWYFGRRDFLQSIGWMSFAGFFTIMLLGTLRAMFPRVIYEKPPVFKAGFPGDYVPGTVSEKYKDEERVWIIRQADGAFIALLAICTHLGCTPRWLSAENKFKCPCHGSGFRGSPSYGVNFEGPAPRPLERVAIGLAPDGQIQIDKSKKFLWEKNQWEEAGATLKV